MNTRLHVGNLDFKVTEIDLTNLFKAFGVVKSSRIIIDRVTGKSKGFGFVEMADSNHARKAVSNLNGQDLLGRNMSVKLAKSRKKEIRRPQRSSPF